MSLPGMQPLDRFQIQLAGELEAGSDVLVYQRMSCDIKTDTIQLRLWRCDWDGGNHRRLLSHDSQQLAARFCPQGQRLAWVDTVSEKPQIHLKQIKLADDGEQLTALESSPSLLSWSPCGQYIAFIMDAPLPEPDWLQMTAAPEECDWADPPKISERLPYKMDGAGWLPQASAQLHVLDVQSREVRQLTDWAQGVNDPFTLQAPLWSPNGEEIYVLHNGSDNPILTPRKLNIWAVNVAEKSTRQVVDFPGSCAAMSLSPDGQALVFTAAPNKDEAWTQYALWQADSSSGTYSALGPFLDRSIAEFLDDGGRGLRFSPKGDAVYALYDDEGRTRLARFDLAVGHEIVVDELAQGSSGYGLGSSYALFDDGDIAFVRGRGHEWPEIYRKADDGSVSVLTDMNQELAAQRALAQPRNLRFHNPADGQALEAWLYTPPNFDPKQSYPLILEIHGGPHNNFGDRFWPRIQVMAAAGYCVLLANPRGSTSYGHAFSNGIHHCYPGPDIGDLLAAVDTACAFDFVDEQSLFVTGISGGGTLTTALVAATDRFRAAAALCPFVEWTSQSLGADVAPLFRYMMPGQPWEQPEHYWKHSTLSQVDKVKTPVMLQGGELDERTPFAHAEMYYQALKFRGVDTVLVKFEGENHGTSARPSHGMQSIELLLSWFAKYR